MLGDGAIEKYGRDDLYDVFLAMEQWNFVKACKWPVNRFPKTPGTRGTLIPLLHGLGWQERLLMLRYSIVATAQQMFTN